VVGESFRECNNDETSAAVVCRRRLSCLWDLVLPWPRFCPDPGFARFSVFSGCLIPVFPDPGFSGSEAFVERMTNGQVSPRPTAWGAACAAAPVGALGGLLRAVGKQGRAGNVGYLRVSTLCLCGFGDRSGALLL